MPRGKSGPRMLSGLSLDNLVAEEPEDSIEQENEDEATDKQPSSRRSLRQSKSETAPIYDMKYHPMDVVTRPNRAPTIRHRSKSVSFALDDDYNSDESSELSSAPSDEDGDSSGDEESEEEDVDAPHRRMIATPRTPDPRSVRHSARSEARKPINYSKKFHPQDYGLPGYKHRAQPQMQFVAHPQVHIFSSASPKKRKHLLPTPEDDGQIDLVGDYDEAVAEEEEEREDRRPRKMLKSIHPNISGSPRFPKTKTMSAKQMPAIPDSDGLEDLVDMAMIGSQPPSRRQLDTMPEENIDNVLDSIKQDHQKLVELASNAKTDQEMIEISSVKSDDTDEEVEDEGVEDEEVEDEEVEDEEVEDEEVEDEEVKDEEVEDEEVEDEVSADQEPDPQDSTIDAGTQNGRVGPEQRPAESSSQNTQHENDEEMGPEPEPRTFFHAMSQRFSGLFASNQQVGAVLEPQMEDNVEEEVMVAQQPQAVTEMNNQPEQEQHQSSEFEEQFAITKSSYITADEPNEDDADGSQPKLPNETGPNEIEPDEDEPNADEPNEDEPDEDEPDEGELNEDEPNEDEPNEEETGEDDLSRSDPLRLVPQSDDGKVPTSDSAASECRN